MIIPENDPRSTFVNQRKYILIGVLIIIALFSLFLIYYFVQSPSVMFILFIFLLLLFRFIKTVYDKIKEVLTEIREERNESRPNTIPIRDVNRLRLALREGDFTPEDYEALLALDDDNELKFLRGASLSDIKRLPILKIPKLNEVNFQENVEFCSQKLAKVLLEKSCSICLEDYRELDDVITIPCFHQFHKVCISKWLQEKASCPICHSDVF
jgi:Ca2+/Na+ antiporter